MTSENRTYHEPAKDVPVLGHWDVIVAGGGPAGCAAALAAARCGAETLIVEKAGHFGGQTVDALVAVILSTNGADFQGIWHDYIRAARRRRGASSLKFKPAVPRDKSDYKARHRHAVAVGDYFDIPYGCVVARGVDNLLMAGQCISASHVAESSARIQQTCIATGQAAGTAAALSLEANTTPRELDPRVVIDRLDADRAATEPAFDELRELPIADRDTAAPDAEPWAEGVVKSHQ